jgi:hypothetical protein
MRDISLDSQSFLRELESVVGKKRQHFLLSTSALDNSNRFKRDWENSFILKDRSLCTLTILGIFSWYIPEEFGVLLRLDLEEKVKNNEDLFFLRLLLKSKVHCLNFLLDTKLWHTRDFFGNIFTEKNIQKALKSVRPRFRKTSEPTKLVYRRGYKDKGSRRKDVNPNAFIDTSSLVRDEEIRKQSQDDTLAFLQAFLE